MQPADAALVREAGSPPSVVLLATTIGVGIRYYLETDLVAALGKNHRIVVVASNPDELRARYSQRYPQVVFDGFPDRSSTGGGGLIRVRISSIIATCADYFRTMGMAEKMNRAIIRDMQRHADDRLRQTVWKFALPFVRALAGLMSRSRPARLAFETLWEWRARSAAADALVARYAPAAVVASSPGWWANEEHVLRAAKQRGIPTVAVVAGWEHTCSKGLPGMRPDRVIVWSEVQRQELVDGSDFRPSEIAIAGAAHFDRYLTGAGVPGKREFFAEHGLDPSRRLITFACSFVGLSSNVSIVEGIAHALHAGRIEENAQLLIRLHPTHMKAVKGQYAEILRERPAYEELSRQYEHVRLSYPQLTSATVPNAAGKEDSDTLAAILKHSDVLVTMFSTMVVEAALHDLPTITAVIDPPEEWRWRQTLPISQALDWPTHQRIVESGATIIARSTDNLVDGINTYLRDRQLHQERRRKFAVQEVTHLDGRAGVRAARFIESMVVAPPELARL